MHRFVTAVVLAVLLAPAALAVGFVKGRNCAIGPAAADLSQDPATFCPTTENGVTSSDLYVPHGGTCSWDDGGSGVSLEILDPVSGQVVREIGADVACLPGVRNCSVYGVYPSQTIRVRASATCANCKIVCGRMF